MSALFGHVKGAFTGEVQSRPGAVALGGRGRPPAGRDRELGLDEQAMLLHAIEDKAFLPVGTDREAQSDFQLVAGTNRDLSQAVRTGRFRDDLLARINLWTFRLPGLPWPRDAALPSAAKSATPSSASPLRATLCG
jgi:transcriptional regulatory protein RtcR